MNKSVLLVVIVFFLLVISKKCNRRERVDFNGRIERENNDFVITIVMHTYDLFIVKSIHIVDIDEESCASYK